MATLIFNSRAPACKSPFGAVPAGTHIVFRAGAAGCPPGERPTLRVYAADRWDEPVFSALMEPDGELDGTPAFRAVFAPGEPALLFYDFELCGVTYRHGGGGAAVGDLCEHFQLTVYDGAADFAEGFSGGVMYQIFPDRFAEEGGPLPCPYGDRRLHPTRGELPLWRDMSPDTVNKDYFGGNLRGITRKLDFLASLSVTCIYLNPIFESHSNHRYDTADYMRIDPLLGTEEDFSELCREAGKRGIRIILDGVFNHTGADSRYFDRYGRYGGHGACSRAGGPCDGWYDFGSRYKCGYRAWWDFPNLPSVNHDDPGFRGFICGEGGVIDHWLTAGAAGFRLDVADELSDDFIRDIRRAVKRHGGDKLLLGEVWEDATNKISYGVRRRYLLGGELDAVMNYPAKDAVLRWLRCGGTGLGEALCRMAENFPAPSLDLAMNLLSTHDTVRALTVFGGPPCAEHGREWQAAHHYPSPAEYEHGKRLLLLAFAIEYMLPGIPSVYYGDEAGMFGYRDPFNRCFYPWGQEDEEILSTARALGRVRAENSVLKHGAFLPILFTEELCCFARRGGAEELLLAVNRGGRARELPAEFAGMNPIYGALAENGLLPPLSAAIFK